MRIQLAALLLALSATLTPSAQAGDGPVVVELYTSQGCSSCPPADALLTRLAKRDDVVALALHVDYWDYIGWKDRFGDPAFSARQKAYAQAGGHRSVYTPQMIVGGVDHIVGTKPMQLMDAIGQHKSKPDIASLRLERTGDRLSISLKPVDRQRLAGTMVVQLVQFDQQEDVRITRGENAGKTIHYSNIVTMWKQIGTWDGSGNKNMTVNMGNDNAPVAVILQRDGYGPVIAAAQLR